MLRYVKSSRTRPNRKNPGKIALVFPGGYICFSVQVDKDIKKLAKRFKASVSAESWKDFDTLMELEKTMEPKLFKEELGLKRRPKSFFRDSGADGRIYPNYFAPVIVWENSQRVIKTMRYRVRPQWAKEEIPSKYNVFNARVDSLEKRKTWNGLFMKNHALFPFIRFYEWVEDDKGKKVMINFSPENHEMMWAPALFDTWRSKSGKIQFSSFAIITDDPPAEIEELGHDRCPIFLKEDQINSWLQPIGKSEKEMYSLLKEKESVYYEHFKVA